MHVAGSGARKRAGACKQPQIQPGERFPGDVPPVAEVLQSLVEESHVALSGYSFGRRLPLQSTLGRRCSFHFVADFLMFPLIWLRFLFRSLPVFGLIWRVLLLRRLLRRCNYDYSFHARRKITRNACHTQELSKLLVRNLIGRVSHNVETQIVEDFQHLCRRIRYEQTTPHARVGDC